jgi:hypothetical protein
MSVAYYQLSADDLKQEREKQLEIVRTAAPDDYFDEWHKLSVMEGLIAWHATEAYRRGGVKDQAVRSKVKRLSPRKQTGPFEFGRAGR